jgi:DNA polymerase-3 subunit beta
MRVGILQENLSKGMGIVSRAIAARSTLPVLSNVYIEAQEDGRLKLAATNLEIGVTCWVGAKVEEPGAVTVPARLFADLVNQSPPERIELSLDERAMELRYKCAQVDSKIKGIAASEFPIMPTATQDGAVALPAALLKEMIAQVAFAAATDESRPILTGVLIEGGGDTLTLAAADGFRLSVRSAALPTALEPFRAIVPARALTELARIIGDVDEVSLRVTDNRNQIVFDAGQVVLVSQLIEGNFPDYRRIIPATPTTATTVDTALLLKAVRRAYIFARDAANNVRLSINGNLTIHAEAAETGGNVEPIEAQIEGAGHEIALNAKYLIDALGAVNGARVVLRTSGPTNAALFEVPGQAGWQHVIMPMHIGDKR